MDLEWIYSGFNEVYLEFYWISSLPADWKKNKIKKKE
jgi:hypothetical protein